MSLASATKVSQNILADYLLGGAGLNKQEKLMIRTMCGNRHTFEDLAIALRKQHPSAHERGDTWEAAWRQLHVASARQSQPKEL